MATHRFLFTGLILLFIFNPQSYNIYSQKVIEIEDLKEGTYPVTIVTLGRDTLKGKVSVDDENELFTSIRFIDEHNRERTYYPYDLLSFQIGNNHYVGNVMFNDGQKFNRVFVLQLTEGYLKYYKLLVSLYHTKGPYFYYKTYDYYYLSYGNLPPNKVRRFRDLSIYTQGLIKIDNIFYKRKYNKAEIPGYVNEYNQWLITTMGYQDKRNRDSINSLTKLTISEAEKDSLLYMQSTDKDIFEYFFRIIYYGKNSPDYVGYDIHDIRNNKNQKVELGLRIGTSSGYNKIGVWKYFYKGNGIIKKDEYYNSEGNLDGEVIYYDRMGKISKTEYYKNGTLLSDEE